jgi:hypothetical protein
MEELNHSSTYQAAGTTPPDFEIIAPTEGGLPFHLPVAIKSLSAGGVILEVHYPPEGLDLREVEGRGGIIHLPVAGNGTGMAIRGTVLWTRPQASDNPHFLLGLELEEPTVEMRQALEEHLPIATKDIKELWDHWDRLQENPTPAPPPRSAQQGLYVVGIGVVLGGLILQNWGPENLRTFGFILVLYGCVALAGKIVWSLWRQRRVAKNQESMALDRSK